MQDISPKKKFIKHKSVENREGKEIFITLF